MPSIFVERFGVFEQRAFVGVGRAAHEGADMGRNSAAAAITVRCACVCVPVGVERRGSVGEIAPGAQGGDRAAFAGRDSGAFWGDMGAPVERRKCLQLIDRFLFLSILFHCL